MFFPFSLLFYHPIAPDKLLAIDERKMTLAVSKVRELRLLFLPHSRVGGG